MQRQWPLNHLILLKRAETGLLARSLNNRAAVNLAVTKFMDRAGRELAWTEIERELGTLQGPDGSDLPGEMLIGVGTK